MITCRQWFHFDFFGLNEKNAEQYELDGTAWFCPECVTKRGPAAQPQKANFEWLRKTSAISAMKLVGLSENVLAVLPTKDVVAQHWDPTFRAAIRDNNFIAPKTAEEVAWDETVL